MQPNDIANEFFQPDGPDPDNCELSLRAASGTCCPDMRIVRDECQGCGRVIEWRV